MRQGPRCQERSESLRLTTVCRACRNSASWPTVVGRVVSLRPALDNKLDGRRQNFLFFHSCCD